MTYKYDNEKQTIYFQKDCVLIKIGDVYEKVFLYNEIREVFFNMDEYGYYFRIQANRLAPPVTNRIHK